MKTFLALTFLAALSLVAGFNMENLVPIYRVMPVNPRHTAEEWQEIYAAAETRSEDNLTYKKGAEPQPEFAGKVHVPLNEQANRITGGIPPPPPLRIPWMAGIVIGGSGFCGGSLVRNNWVLTAAQCRGSTFQITLGSIRRDGNEASAVRVTVGSANFIPHQNYNPNNLNNDIALIRLPSDVPNNNFISPIRLCNVAVPVGLRARVCGWGRTSDSSNALSQNLQCIYCTVISNQQCAQTFGNIIIASTLCCATSNGQSPCHGDSGGALDAQMTNGHWTQIGVVSFVAAAGCQRGFPVGFARITSFLGWICPRIGGCLC